MKQAINECLAERNPDAKTCKRLAAFYIILDHLQGVAGENGAYTSDGNSNKSNFPEIRVDVTSNTEFADAVNGRLASDIWPVIDELMTVLQATNPRLYAGVMRQIAET